MSLKKKCKVVMLPTDKINKVGDICKFDYGLNIAGKADLGYSTQHLYIVSSDKIEEGDWFIRDTEIYQCFKSHKDEIEFKTDEKSVYCGTNTFWDRKFCKKIIATTDKLPTEPYQGHYEGIDCTNYVPQPSTSFIEKYIKVYNDGTPIVDVMVEYEIEPDFVPDFISKVLDYEPQSKIKVDSKNQITITKVKDSWTREELKDLMWKTCVQSVIAHKKMKDPFNEMPKWFDNWVEQNL
jgi:hypothetical protein